MGLFKTGGIKKGVNTMFRKGHNTLEKINKGLGKASDVLHKGSVVVENVGKATGISQLEAAGHAGAKATNQLGNVLDKAQKKLDRIDDKSKQFQNKVNTGINRVQNKADEIEGKGRDALQKAKNVKKIIKNDGGEVINDAKQIFKA